VATFASKLLSTVTAMAAIKRIQKDLLQLQQTPVEGVKLTPSESNMLEWTGALTPGGPLYGSCKFRVKLEFPTDYPFKG
jgi:ubiquitin-protein ligase